MSKPNINITIDLVLGQPSMEILHLAASASPAVTPPVNTAAPVISGEACVGAGLSCTTGTWSNGGGTISGYTYQWYADGSPIGGATANTFTVTASELNASVTCQVVATNEYGASDPAESNAIVILLVVPSNLVAPSITGSAFVGELLTCDPGTWDNGGGTISGYSFQWYADASPISGAVANTYVLTASEAGAEITCTVVATNECGDSAPATSNATDPVVTVPTNTVAPAISGTPTQGETLSCTTGTWNAGGGTISAYTYQWAAGGTPISGATSATYLLTAAEVGLEITCSVVAENEAGFSDPVTSNALGPVAAAVGGIDEFTMLLLRAGTPDGGSSFVDASPTGRTLTPAAAIVTDTDLVKFGPAATLSTPVNNSYITAAYSTDFDFGTGDWNICAWVYKQNNTGTQALCCFGGFSFTGWNIYVGGGDGKIYVFGGGSWSSKLTSTGAITPGQWDFISISKVSGSLYIHINGIYDSSVANVAAWGAQLTPRLMISSDRDSSTGLSWMNGNIEELMISKGSGRLNQVGHPLYCVGGDPTNNFTVPSGRFTT